jgi:hypothetical protein
MGGRSLGRDERRRRQARRVGAVGFAIAAVAPWLLWRHAVAAVATEFHLDVDYLAGWVPFLLIAVGLAFLVPVAWSAGRDPDSRWYPQARNAYLAWGVTLYLLGCGLATQVAQMLGGLTGP